MTVSQWSDLLMVSAAIGYLVAFALSALEWAFARGLAPTRQSDGSEDPTRLRVDLVGRLSLAATVISFGLNLAAVVLRGIAAGRAPWGNMYEFVSAAVLVIVGTYLVLVWRLHMRWLGLGINLLATVGLGVAVTVFYVDVAPLVPALHSAWFIVHIAAAVIAGAAFNLGAVASLLYLIRVRAEERGKPITGYLARVPDADRLDLIAYRLNAFAFPLWTFTIIAGSVWAQYAWGRFWNWDPKRDLVVCDLGGLCGLSARPSNCWLAGKAGSDHRLDWGSHLLVQFRRR